MAAAIPEQHCNAKDLDQEQRKSIALNSLKKQGFGHSDVRNVMTLAASLFINKKPKQAKLLIKPINLLMKK